MAIGYELKLTPLQLLTFYNAVANDGKMMKPYLVSEVQRYGETLQRFPPTVLRKRIASPKAIKMLREMLEEVVETGTAKDLRSDIYKFAGKTGTTQLNYHRIKNNIRIGGYQASFAGYFPADNPEFSCIVVINSPKTGSYYGGSVAGPVFREIADKSMSSRPELAEIVNSKGKPVLSDLQLPTRSAGEAEEMTKLLTWLNVAHKAPVQADWIVTKADSVGFILAKRDAGQKVVPNVVGMGLRDALYLLENRGLKVRFSGYGKVKQQSIAPGTGCNRQSIFLTLE
jgi:cell division protein FtsI (penicillin-binding protein 3)